MKAQRDIAPCHIIGEVLEKFRFPVLTNKRGYDRISGINSTAHHVWRCKQFNPTLFIRSEMTIHITSQHLIGEIEKDFSDIYPFLKLKFSKKEYGTRSYLQRIDSLPVELSLAIASGNNTNGKLDITSSMTGKELEKQFEAEFGVHAQLFRKSGKSWLEITFTDTWTLKQQNERGREISSLN